MINTYTGVHADQESVRKNNRRNRFMGAASSVALAMTLQASTSTVEQPIVAAKAPAKSIFELDCAGADATAIRNTKGEKVVAVRLDCVPDGKASDRGALVLHIANLNGIIPGTREKDHTIFEATCRETFDRDIHADYEGESSEWVRLVDPSASSVVDNMPYVDTHPVKHVVNSAYVVGEKTLPECGTLV